MYVPRGISYCCYLNYQLVLQNKDISADMFTQDYQPMFYLNIVISAEVSLLRLILEITSA